MHRPRLARFLWPAAVLTAASPTAAGEGDRPWSWPAAGFDAAEQVSALVSTLLVLASEGYRQNPAVMLGLLALIVLPMLTPIGLLLRTHERALPAPLQDTTQYEPPARVGWVEVEDVAGSRRPIGRGMLRIGRQDDNELCIKDATVHRYHAVIYHSPEGEAMVADLGGDQGNGIRINGEAVVQSRLKPGDSVQVGKVRLRIGAEDRA